MATIFSKFHGKYVVGMVDVVGSTDLISTLSAEQTDSFFTIFLTHFNQHILKTGAEVVKNLGDGFLFYMRESSDMTEKNCKDVLSCAQSILVSVGELNEKLKAEHLPEVSLRLSMSYGSVSAMLNDSGEIIDIFGSTVNTCVKMNKMAELNSTAIGRDLSSYLSRYAQMKEIGTFKLASVESFPVFMIAEFPPLA